MEPTHVPIHELWADFTLASPLEETIQRLAEFLAECIPKDASEAIPKKSRFALRGRYFPIKFHTAAMDSPVRKIFGITGPFLLVKCPFTPAAEDLPELTSLLSCALESALASFPALLHIEHQEYVGVSRTRWFSSKCNWFDQISTEPIKLFDSNFPGETVEDFSFKQHSLVKAVNLPKQLRYTRKTYYSNCTEPLMALKIQAEGKTPRVYNYRKLPLWRIRCEMDFRVNIRTNLRYFADLIPKAAGYTKWEQLLLEDDEVYARKTVHSLFYADALEAGAKPVIKAAPHGSMLAKLAVFLATSSSLNELGAIWIEFVKQLRRNYDTLEFVPGVDRDGPCYRYCLLYQKLEMLNVCIERLKSGDIGLKPGEKLNDRIKVPDVLIVPGKTEDQLMENAVFLSRLGNDQKERAIFQAKQLCSDMSAFKAENPECKFADFVEWYSPPDIVNGELSPRMQQEGNVWVELWDKAPPILASEQDPLFDPVMEGEMVLDYFDSLTPGEVLGDLLPVLLNDAAEEITRSLPTDSLFAKQILASLSSAYTHFHQVVEDSDNPLPLEEYLKQCRIVISSIESAAQKTDAMLSLVQKFPSCHKLVDSLLLFGERVVADEKEKEIVWSSLTLIGVPTQFTVENETSISSVSHRLYISNKSEYQLIGLSQLRC